MSFFIGLGVLIILALVAGQARIVLTAWRDEKAGLGRLTYSRPTEPIGFWLILSLELVGLLLVGLYLLAMVYALFVQ